ncbi:phosphotriesterase family protein [Actinomycetota bacterium]
MAQIETIRGQVDTADLGRTYMHEHVFVTSADIKANYPQYYAADEKRIEDAAGKLQRLLDDGIRTIVDPTVVGLGRDIPLVQRVAERVPDLNIVVATGMYTYDSAPHFFDYRGPALNAMVGAEVPEPMVEMFVGDIRDGIAGTDVKAGLLKCAIDAPGMTPGVERIMRAVGAAHLETGTPITVHTHPDSRTGLLVKQLLVDEMGVEPSRIVLGHSGDTADADHLSELAEAGFWLGMDRFGITLEASTEQRVGVVVELAKRGFADRMVLAHDASCHIDWVAPEIMPAVPDWHYGHIAADILPALLAAGVAQEQIDQMLVDNPRRYFEGA